MGVSLGYGGPSELAELAVDIGYARTLKSKSWRMESPPNEHPSDLLSVTDIRSVTGIGDDQSYTDGELTDMLVSAEGLVEAILNSPLKEKVVKEWFRTLARRLSLRVRGLGEQGLGDFKSITLKATLDDGSEMVIPEENYLLDTTDWIAAIVVKSTPGIQLSSDVEAPIMVQYTYTPRIPNRVKSAVEMCVRAFFNARNMGMPFPYMSLQKTVTAMLEGIVPRVVGMRAYG